MSAVIKGNVNITGGIINDITELSIYDSDTSHVYNITTGNIASNINIGFPVLTSNDTFVFANFTQTLTNKTLTLPQINDTSSDHQYIFSVNELTSDRTITLPLLTGNDTFVFADHIQTLTNKTLTLPQINDTSSDHQYIFAVNELTNDRTITLPLLTDNDTFVFANHIQTLTNKTLTLPQINDTSADHQFVFAVNELTADRTITLPLLTDNDTFVFENHIQTITNKTWGDNLDMNNNKIVNLDLPTSNNDATTKAYVDGLAAGLSTKKSCRVATTARLSAYYTGGTDGIGDGSTLTANSDGAIGNIDDIAVIVGDRILVKDQYTAFMAHIDFTPNSIVASDYFTIELRDKSEGATIVYSVWYQVAGGGVAPGVGTPIQVTVVDNTPSHVATQTIAALNAYTVSSSAICSARIDPDNANAILITASVAISTGETISDNNTDATFTIYQASVADEVIGSAHNGIYEVTDLGDGASPYILTRTSDLDGSPDNEINSGDYTYISYGTVHQNQGFTILAYTNIYGTTTDGFIAGYANIDWSQFSGTASFTAGDGIEIIGNNISVDLKTNGGLVIEATELALDLGASDITGTLAVDDGGTGLDLSASTGILYLNSGTVQTYPIIQTVNADTNNAAFPNAQVIFGQTSGSANTTLTINTNPSNNGHILYIIYTVDDVSASESFIISSAGLFTDASGTASSTITLTNVGQSLTMIWNDTVGKWFLSNGGFSIA